MKKMETDLYQPPETTDLESHDVTDAEAIREEHIKHEASIKSIGVLYWLGGVIMILSAIGMVLGGMVGEGEAEGAEAASVTIGMGIFCAVFGILQIVVAQGIRKLRKSIRGAVGFLSGIGLLGFPVGTLINAYILYLVFSAKGKYIFSDEYQAIIEATPHIKYKTSKLVMFFLILLVVLVVIGIVAAVSEGS